MHEAALNVSFQNYGRTYRCTVIGIRRNKLLLVSHVFLCCRVAASNEDNTRSSSGQRVVKESKELVGTLPINRKEKTTANYKISLSTNEDES